MLLTTEHAAKVTTISLKVKNGKQNNKLLTRRKGHFSSNYLLSWTLHFLCYFVCLTSCSSKEDVCTFPDIPRAAKYINVTGGLGQDEWKIKYDCDSGYELFGDDVRKCKNGKWRGDMPHCAVNVALNKPAKSSSQVGKGAAGNAVDGSTSTVHEGDKCTETKSEKSPWWTVDLLDSYPIKHVRLTTRCCDDIPVKKAEIRIGNSTTPGNNPLCNWIPKALDEGSSETLDCYEDLVGRYVSIVMTGVETVLSLCEVEVFSTQEISLSSCSSRIPPDEVSVFQGQCYHFLPKEVAGFEDAKDACKENGLHLLAELDEHSTNYITSRMDRKLETSDNLNNLMTWLGASRETNFGQERWSWVTDTGVEGIEWGRGQPNNYNQEQNCAVLDSELDWKWNDISCRISADVICQGSPANCPSPPVNQGSFYSGSFEVGSTLSYHCPLGEMPLGKQNVTCLASGEWSEDPITCKKVDCGQVPGLVDGEIHVLDGRNTWKARVRYKCKENYSLMDGDEERSCEESGWSGRAPKCVYTKCPVLDPVENSQVKTIGDKPNSLGYKIIYTCEEGHKSSGSLSRECLIGGRWSGSTPRCIFVDCGDPPKVSNGHASLLDGRTSFNAEAQYLCDEDYQLESLSSIRTCQANGAWSRNSIKCAVIQCPPPKAPNGGRVSGYDRTVHSKIEFSCLTGHILEGPSELTCTKDGTWSSTFPSCRFVDCRSVPPLPDGTAHYVNGSTHLGSQVKYVCDRSYSMEGQAQRTCLESGRWSGKAPSCTEIRCAFPTRPNNTVISVSSTERLHGTSVLRSKLSSQAAYRVGSTLKYRCERGYILEKEDGRDARVMTRRCTRSGTWTGSSPTCKFVDCGKPEEPENSKVTLPINQGTYYGSVAFYKCNDHFNLNGFEKRRCESDGKWKPEAPNCTVTLCKPLTEPSNGQMVLTTLRIGGRATFTCNHGFGLKGDDDIECLSSGSWSSWPPSCVEIDCGQPDSIDNGRIFLSNKSTVIGSIVEYHCFPGFERTGPFERACLDDGYWSGHEPSCDKPIPITILANDNTVDGTKNVRTGSISDEDQETSSVGMWIGVALGLIVVIGLLILGVYFYRKQRALATKPPPYRDSRSSNAGLRGDYVMHGVYGGSNNPPTISAPLGSNLNGSSTNGMSVPPPLPSTGPNQNRIGQRPPPPIQMYSMDESGEDHRGPIYDTINDDSNDSAYSRSNNGSDKGQYVPSSSTFTPSSQGLMQNGSSGYPNGSRTNGGFSHEYDVPEGSEHLSGSSRTGSSSVGAVTINGIAV